VESNASVVNNTFYSNKVVYSGAAISTIRGYSSIQGSIFRENESRLEGAAIYSIYSSVLDI